MYHRLCIAPPYDHHLSPHPLLHGVEEVAEKERSNTMPLERTRLYDDAKKAYESPDCSNEWKKYPTFEDRKNHHGRFLQSYEKERGPQFEEKSQLEVANHDESGKSSWHDWAGQVRDKVSGMVSYLWEKKSALLLGVMLASAGGIRVEGRGVRSSTALRHLDSINATGLPPAQGFNNFSHPTALKFNLYNVTPAVLEHLKKLGVKDPEQFIRNVQTARKPLAENRTSSEVDICAPPDCDCSCLMNVRQEVDCDTYCPPGKCDCPCSAPIFGVYDEECCNYPGTYCDTSMERIGYSPCC